MIETPAAALTVGQIGRYADFFSVGTNDLTQYTLVAGRDDATVSDYYDETHASILRLLGIIIGEASGKPVTICGEMAGREEVIPTLLELGFRALRACEKIRGRPSRASGRTAKYPNFCMAFPFVVRLSNHERDFFTDSEYFPSADPNNEG